MAKKNATKITELKEKVAQFMSDMDKLKKKGKNDDDEEMKRLKKMADDIQAEIVKLEKEDDKDDDESVMRAELEKRDKRIAQLEADRRKDQVVAMVAKIKVPSLRPAFSSIYSYGLEHADVKVAVFTTKDGKETKEEKSLVGITDDVVAEINRQAERLFMALATQKGGRLAERAEDFEEKDERPVDVILDEKVQKALKEKSAEFKGDYEKAMKFVLDGDPELKEKYVASFSH